MTVNVISWASNLWRRWRQHAGHSNTSSCRCGRCRYWKDEYRRD